MTNLILPYHVRRDTLAYLKAQPLFIAKSMRDVDLRDSVDAMKSYLPGCGLKQPENEAINFYAANAVWAEIVRRYAEDEPLPAEALSLAKTYVAHSSAIAQRAIYYLLLIITRESRHVHNTANPKLHNEHGKLFADFNKALHGYDSMGAKDYFLANFPKMKLGAYADAISYVFHLGSNYFSHGYGGDGWVDVADAFKALVDGKFSPEMVTDVSWALSHNNGPIFNKGMTYSQYAGQGYALKQILDVQRAGQIPEFIADNTLSKSYVSLFSSTFVDRARILFPEAWGKQVDWHKVEAAGAVQSYGTLKMAQQPKVNAASLPGNVYWVTPSTHVKVVNKIRKEAA